MGQIVIKVNGREFPLNCDDGQEPSIRRLAQYVDAKVMEFAKTNGQVGEARLILLAAITIADELSDANDMIQRERSGVRGGNEGSAGAVREIAQRVEAIATRRETP